jgi:ATP-dependent DNA helicase RecQ
MEDVEGVEDATVTAQKILSGVARTGERFGITHIVDVLVGANTERVRQWEHQALTTYGLLKELPRKSVTNLIYQLVDHGLLERTQGDRPIVRLNSTSWEVLRGERTVQLQKVKEKPVSRSRYDSDSWEGVDTGLFESLRQLRRELAEARGVPAYVIFGDATLRELARERPLTLESFATIRGVGEQKLKDLGGGFVAHIRDYLEAVPDPTSQTPEAGV